MGMPPMQEGSDSARSHARTRFHVPLLLLALLTVTVQGQTYTMINGTVATCTGAFMDSGGLTASGYSNNENYTYSICPDTPGGAVSLNFLVCNLSTAGAAPMDALSIYDGNSTAAPLLGVWTGALLQGQIISASASNPSGCLTVTFRSNNAGIGTFTALISCFQPCVRPTAVASNGSLLPLKICPGGTVNLDGSSSYAANGATIASYTWDFGDGTLLANAPAMVAHSYAQAGGYTAQLIVEDDQGCASSNQVDLLTLVGTTPSFNGTTGATGCTNETLQLNGMVSGTTWYDVPQVELGGAVALPGQAGQCFTSTLTYTQFAPGQTLTDVNQLLGICVNMEHSYMGDLIVRIISPNGQTVVLHQQGGGPTYLGGANDLDNQNNPVAGSCWSYCFSPNATWGTWGNCAAGGATPQVMMGGTPVANSLMPGTYSSFQSLGGLVGSPLNGTWTFQVCDMLSLDNGFVCDWSLNFDPALYPALFEFTPVYGAGCDSTFWMGSGMASISADCDQITVTGLPPGTYPFVFTAVDDFGCTHDTTVQVTIIPDLAVEAGVDLSTCGTPVQLSASMVNSPITGTCNHQLLLFDSFGDGWMNNGAVIITINGVPTSWTLNNGSSTQFSIPIPHGATLTVSYLGGGIWAPEQSFVFKDSEGNTLISATNPPNGLVWSGTASCPGGALVYSWSPAAGLSDPNIAAPVATVSTTMQYCVTVHQEQHPDCAVTDCMTIAVQEPPGPGTDTLITVCNTGAPFAMFSRLAGTPEAGGTWGAPGGGVHSGTFVPGTDAAGTYTYQVQGTGACSTATAQYTVDIQVASQPDGGTNGALTMCSTTAPTSLFGQLGGTPDPGGTWSGPSPVMGGQFNPASMIAGLYTYAINVPPPCPSSSTTVLVTVHSAPNAGSNGAMTMCLGQAPSNLFDALGGTPTSGGMWNGPSPVVNQLFDAGTMAPGTYTYTVSGTAPCPAATSQVVVTTTPLPNAGSSSSLAICATDAPVDLLAQLGGTPEPGGTWTGPSAVNSGQFDPASMTAGVYTYTISLPAPCLGAGSTVTIALYQPPQAGTDGAYTFCASDPPAPLINHLGGTPDPNGTWSGPSPVVGGSFVPGSMVPGTYTYVVSAPAACPDAEAHVVVTTVAVSDAGSDGTLALCTSASPVSLLAQLGGTPDATGTWSGPNGTVTVQFDPSSGTAGTYLYVVGTSPCPADSAEVEVTLQEPPEPGVNGSLTLCPDADAVGLFGSLGGSPDANGSWTAPNGSSHAGSFDPATDAAGTYTYTVPALAPCPNVNNLSEVMVAVVAAPSAGPDAVSCTLSAPLQATGNWSTGSWSAPAGVSITAPGAASTTVAVPSGGQYPLYWNSTSAEGCQFSDSVSITFTGPITAVVDVTGALCHGSCDGNYTVQATGGNVGLEGYGYGLSSGNGEPLPISTGYCAGNYLLAVLDSNSCTATTAFTIPEPPPLAMGQITASDALCANSCDGTVLVSSDEGQLFSVGNGAPQASSMLSGICPGSYTVTMWNAAGCAASGTVLIGSPPPVEAHFTVAPMPVFVDVPAVTFINYSSANAIGFQWDFGDGTASTEASPAHTFPVGVAMDYQVCLRAITANGCVDLTCMAVPVVDHEALFVPSAFTPDGDGRNDLFQVSGSGLRAEGFQLRIYTRWGERIYETTDPAAGWDGTVNGKAATSDVYVWSLTAYNQYGMAPYELKGHVTLVR